MQFSDAFLELTAPNLTKLTASDAPAVIPLPDYVQALATRQTLGPKRYADTNVVVYLARFASRLAVATREYSLGRDQLMDYVAALPQHRVLAHAAAVSHFESCVLNAHLAMMSLERAARLLAPSQSFILTDDYLRLRLLNNRIKHFDEDVEAAGKAGRVAVAAPLWLTNDGIACERASLTYVELAALLEVHAGDASAFCTEWLS